MSIPSSWTPDVPMQRIICHWTGGSHSAGDKDLRSYHFLIEGDGTLHRGRPSVALNSGRTKRGYAAHTRNCNSGSIGVSVCCMGGACESPFDAGNHPMTRAQWEALVAVTAELCRRYGIPVTPHTVLTHAEVEPNLGIAQAGKWDITRLAFAPGVVGAKACGDLLRREVKAAAGDYVIKTAPDDEPLTGRKRRRMRRSGEKRPLLVALLEELWPIVARALSAGLNAAIREILKR